MTDPDDPGTGDLFGWRETADTGPAALPWVDYQQPEPLLSGSGLLALVGEAPGKEEARQGRPFCGRSGKLLDETLARAGIDRARCLVANTFREQPPDNKVGHFFASRRKAKELGENLAEGLGPFAGSQYCLERFAHHIAALRETLAQLRPGAIVALGRTPLWALTGRDRPTEVRGQPLPCRLVEGLTVIPTFHPSYLIRGRWAEVELLLADLQQALALTGRQR